ncbi:MAG TPA: FtsX-like permease family protein [Anaeromyxobacter sp.]
MPRPRAKGRPFFGRWLRRSVARSLQAGAVGTASLALAAALVFCLVAVSGGVERRLGAELAAYGANLLVLPRSAPLRFGLGALELGPVEEDRRLAEADVRALAGAAGAGVETVAPALLARVRVDGTAAGAIGYPWDALRRLNPLWRVTPRWPEGGEAMAGAALARRLGLAPGREVEVAAADAPGATRPARAARVRIAGVVETGGPEDEDLFLPLGLAQELAGAPGQVSLALVRADLRGRTPDAAARAMEAAVPGAEARTLTQVASAEASLLAKVRRLLLLVTVALGAAAAFTISGTLGMLLLARRQEIGLYLALGAPPRTVRALLLAEAAVSGLAGGVAGCVVGALAAEAVAASVFGAAVPLGWTAAPLALAVALVLALGAALWPVERALRISPCDTLRAS